MKIYKIANFRGEWWIVDGDAAFCDGDVGDVNHEAYVIQHAQSQLTDGMMEWDEWKASKAMEIAQDMSDENDIDENKKYELRNLAQNDPELFLLQNMKFAGIDEDIFLLANGNNSDPRLFAIKNWGWKRMAGNAVETWTLTESDLRSISNGISSAYDNEIMEMEERGEEPDFSIEVASTRTMYWNIPLNVIDSKNIMALREYAQKYRVTANSFKNIIIASDSIRYEFHLKQPKHQDWRDNITKENGKVSAYDGTEVIGVLSFTKYYDDKDGRGNPRYGGSYLMIDHQYVVESYQGKGIMTSMYKTLKEHYPNDKFAFDRLTGQGQKLKDSLVRNNIIELASNKIITSQVSSIMYKGLETPSIIFPEFDFLTPSPDIARSEGEFVAAFKLTGGDYFSPDMMDRNLCRALKSVFGKNINCEKVLWQLLQFPTQAWVELLKGLGYQGFISLDYLYLFDKNLLRFLGFYDFNERTVKKGET